VILLCCLPFMLFAHHLIVLVRMCAPERSDRHSDRRGTQLPQCQSDPFDMRLPTACRQSLTLVPGNTIKGSLWNLVTASFLESSVLALALDIVAVLLLFRLIEPIYGAAELVKLMGLAAAVAGVTCFLLQYATFYAFRRGSILFMERCGFHGVLGALLVATSATPAADALPRKALPGLYLAACLAWSARTGLLSVLPLALPGVAAGWWYVRHMAPADLKGAMLLPVALVVAPASGTHAG
jgi:membrane associated rhomboid family serine protease